ncbi:MAG: hypothetical protein ACLFV8_02190 [Alphaproteobacteria bacterium]
MPVVNTGQAAPALECVAGATRTGTRGMLRARSGVRMFVLPYRDQQQSNTRPDVIDAEAQRRAAPLPLKGKLWDLDAQHIFLHPPALQLTQTKGHG